MKATCKLCENTCDYDKESIKSDTYTINGLKVIICGVCAEDFLKKLTK